MDPLQELLNLQLFEKEERGLLHTPREIYQQPDTWRSTFAIFHERHSEIAQFLTAAGIQDEPEKRPIVFLIGAGTSDHIGQALHHLLRQKWQCEVNVAASTDLLTNLPDFLVAGRRYLWISFSRSGDSPEGVVTLERSLAEYANIRHLVVTCNSGGKMIQVTGNNPRALAIILDDATNDRSLAMTSSFSNMLLFGQCLAHTWSIKEYAEIHAELVKAGAHLLPLAAAMASLLVVGAYASVCFVGSGALAGMAREAALKVLELSAGNIRTESASALGLRHGPMAGLDRETLLVAFVSSEARRRQYEIDLLSEIGSKSLVRIRVAVSTLDSSALREQAELLLTPAIETAIPDLYRPVVDILFAQLLGLFFSIRCGLHPDSPSPNGAIRRVVPNIGIY